MTQREQQFLDNINDNIIKLREENKKFREDTTAHVNALSNKIEQKHIPINLESEMMNSINASISKAFSDALTSYNSPLQKYAINVVSKYQKSIEDVFDEVVAEAIKTDEFKQRVREVLLHKIAKTMISGIDGSVDKTINQMKQDAVFRSRLTLSVNGLVAEFLNHKEKV